jgi:hypothetical protein
MNPNSILDLNGFDIIVTPDIPKMQLSEDCPVTPELRIEVNLWMIEFFGTTNIVPDGQILSSGRSIYVNPRARAMLKVS